MALIPNKNVPTIDTRWGPWSYNRHEYWWDNWKSMNIDEGLEKLKMGLLNTLQTENEVTHQNNHYRPHTEYDGKVMFSVCLFTGGTPPKWGGGAPGDTPPNWGPPRGTPQLEGAPPGVPPNWGGAGGRPRGYPPPKKIDLDKNVGQNLGQKMDKVLDKNVGQKMDKILDKKWTTFWTKKWTNILETFGGGGEVRAVRLLRSRRRTVLLVNAIRWGAIQCWSEFLFNGNARVFHFLRIINS